MNSFDRFKLRISLLKIWFIKNLVVFVELFLLVGVVLILTGQIDEDSVIIASIPVLGEMLRDLSVSIRMAFEQNYSNDIVINIISTIVTVLVTIGVLSSNLRKIALGDIKSVQLKKSLIQAGLYFNRDGQLVKRIEEATNMDLDGDSKIGNTGINIEDLPKERLLAGIKRAGDELTTILTIKIDTESDVAKIKEEKDLTSTEKAIEGVKEEIMNKVEVIATEKATALVETKIKEPNLLQKAASGTKKIIGSFFSGAKEHMKRSAEKAKLKRAQRAEKAKLQKEQKSNEKNNKRKIEKTTSTAPAQTEPQTVVHSVLAGRNRRK
jgi:hypothetical protein